MFQNKMVTPAIPERVYTLCKIVEKKPISNSDLKERMEPEYLGQKTVYFSEYRKAAEELKLITISDNMISLAVDSSIVKSIDAMRRYINGILEEFKNGQFYQVTNAYFEMENKVLSGEKNIASLAPMLSKRLNRPLDATNLHAWRFWVSFLGLGYLQNMFVIPNADVFLKDIISIAALERNHRYSFGEFIAKLRPFCNMVVNSDPLNRKLNYGVSNGLRVLHDTGVIKLEHILDQEDIWNLYPMKAHAISGTVTNVTICK